jgi:hypothetical protein
MPESVYDAFICYRRSDGRAVAHWLRRELQALRVPNSIRQKFGRRLKVYLDVAYERGTTDFYEKTIQPALLASRFLIVIVTPDAVRRRVEGADWIEREIKEFTAGPNEGNVLVVRGAGVLDGPLPAGLSERFPNIEVVDLRGAMLLSFLNPLRAARLGAEKLKIAAPLLDLPPDLMPLLRREEEARQQTRVGLATGAALGTMVAVGSLSAYALISRHDALRTSSDAMYAAGSMALQATALPRNGKVSEVRPLLVLRACDLLDKFNASGTGSPGVQELVTRRLERAAEHDRLDEAQEARRQIDEAIDIADRRNNAKHSLEAVTSLLTARNAMTKPQRLLIGLMVSGSA